MSKPKWDDTQGYVDAGPEVDKNGTGHDDAKGQGKETIHTKAKPPKWSDPQPVVENGPDFDK